MILLGLFLLVFVLSFSSWRARKAQAPLNQLALELTPPARVFVQPSQDDKRRTFLDGQITLHKIDSKSSLVLNRAGNVSSGAGATAGGKFASPCVFLKSGQDFEFHSTLLSKDSDGSLVIHAVSKGSKEIVSFRVS